MVLGSAAVDSSVFVLQGFIQNVPPLLAANGRCACLCINQGAVNLPFNRRGSHAGNYFGICKSAERIREKDARQGGVQRWSHKSGRFQIQIQTTRLMFGCLFVYLHRTWPETSSFVNKCGLYLLKKTSCFVASFCFKYSLMTFSV